MRVWTLGAVLLGLACGGCGNSSEAPPVARSAVGVGAVGAGTASAAAPTPPSDEADPLWRLAAAGDPMDLARLADREGALSLLAAVVAAGVREATALLALPHSDDAELAVGGLCKLLEKREGSGRHALLLSIHGVASRPPAPRERFDPAGQASCVGALTRVGKLSGLQASSRDLASSALRYLSASGSKTE